MQDEFICEECQYSSSTQETKCPLCGGKVVSIEDGLEDRNYMMENNEDMPMAREDLEFDTDELAA